MPAVAGLKRQGASRGAVLSFMIATPETGADSIPVTYALMDPIMTVIRPVAAFITAMTAGLMENRFGGRADPDPFPMGPAPAAGAPPASTVTTRVKAGLRFGFVDLLGDIGPYFMLGVLLAGLITALIPAGLVSGYLGNPLLAMPVMLLVSLPMYVCATASTPIAAALVMKGLDPGAALVFLLAGPATNAATLSMVAAMMGRRTLTIYLVAIVGCSLALGAATDVLYGLLGTSPAAMAGEAAELVPGPVKTVGAWLLAAMIAPSLVRKARGKMATGTA